MSMRRRKKRHDRRFLYRWLNSTVGLAIEQAHVLKLSMESQVRFAEALLAPAAPNAALRKAAEMYDTLVATDSKVYTDVDEMMRDLLKDTQ